MKAAYDRTAGKKIQMCATGRPLNPKAPVRIAKYRARVATAAIGTAVNEHNRKRYPASALLRAEIIASEYVSVAIVFAIPSAARNKP